MVLPGVRRCAHRIECRRNGFGSGRSLRRAAARATTTRSPIRRGRGAGRRSGRVERRRPRERSRGSASAAPSERRPAPRRRSPPRSRAPARGRRSGARPAQASRRAERNRRGRRRSRRSRHASRAAAETGGSRRREAARSLPRAIGSVSSLATGARRPAGSSLIGVSIAALPSRFGLSDAKLAKAQRRNLTRIWRAPARVRIRAPVTFRQQGGNAMFSLPPTSAAHAARSRGSGERRSG
jgi:hypothetical protein